MTAKEIFNKMYDNDAFSQWLGIELATIDLGSCTLTMTVRDEMTNGFGIAHGGITYALADSALAFASNSNGSHALSVDTSINHLKPLLIGDKITARATEQNITKSTGLYQVIITNQKEEQVAIFKGLVFRKNIEWK
jgi:acyl-CoA thioesterase